MKSIDRRLSKLEDWLGVRGDLFLVVLSDAGRRGLVEFIDALIVNREREATP